MSRPAMKPKQPRQRRPHERSVRVIIPELPQERLTLIRITQDGEAKHYWLSPQKSDYGLSYRLERPGHEVEPDEDDTYEVLLWEQGGDSCSCKGFTYGNFCRHVDCLKKLLSLGCLPLPQVPHGPAEETTPEVT